MTTTADSVPFVLFYVVTIDNEILGPFWRASEEAPTGHVAVRRDGGRPGILFLQGDLPAFPSWALARAFQVFAREAAKRNRCNEHDVSTGTQGGMNMSRVTETEGQGSSRTVSGGPEIGRIPLPDYIRMTHPGAVLVGRRSLHWMLFTFFVAGICCGMVLGKLLA